MSPPLSRRASRTTRSRWLVLLLALAVPLQAARAHGHLVKAEPAVDGHVVSIPTLLRLSFSEAPTPALSRITLFDAAMQPVSLGAVAVDPKDGKTLLAAITGKMAPGRYTVRWKIAGDDGHPVNGTFAFTVDASPAASVAVGSVETPMFDASSPAYVTIRAVQFVSIVLLIGVLTLHVVVLPRLAKAGRGEAAYYAEARRRSEPWAGGALWAFGVATIARLAAQHVALFGTDARWGMETTGALLFQSLWGRVWIVAVVGTVIGLWGVRRLAAGRRSGWWMYGTATLALIGTLSFSGHPAAAANRALALAVDALHVLSAGGWVGSLAALMVAAIPATIVVNDERRHQVVAAVVSEFSILALVFALLLTVTGVVAGWRNIGSWTALLHSTYGQLLALKLTVLSVVAGTGAYNWRRVLPVLGTAPATARLRRSAGVELVAAMVVLGITAVLVATPMPMESISMASIASVASRQATYADSEPPTATAVVGSNAQLARSSDGTSGRRYR